MKQMTLAATKVFEKHNRSTRKTEFLARMESLMPWAEFCALIEPHYPKAGNGRPPVAAGAHAADVLHRQLVQPQ
jgi:IS5 family transposase